MTNLEKKLRRDILKASYEAKACHLGSAFSCLKILITLFYEKMEKGDIFLFGKASGASALYAILCDIGMFPKSKLTYYLKNYPLAHKDVPGVIHSVGSVGHGLPIATGLAYANPKNRVFCLISDGDCQEGTTYESALFARHHQLDNLYVIIDNNGFQACGATAEILGLNKAFDFLELTLPNCHIVPTIKGDGVSYMENRVEWHYKNLTRPLLNQALKEL